MPRPAHRHRSVPARAAWLLALLLCSCAVIKEDNRRTLNALDGSLTPATSGGRWALSPVALPTGLVALVADMLVVHPACVLDDAWGDTLELLWEPRDETRFRRAVMLPLVTLATPLVFVGDWLGRVIFPIEPREGDAQGEDDAIETEEVSVIVEEPAA